MQNLSLETPIFLAGHNGMVGSAVFLSLKQAGYSNVITADRAQLDLKNQIEVIDFFKIKKPSYVVIAAAKVGGIKANSTYQQILFMRT